MKKFLLSIILTAIIISIAYSSTSISLTDNTDVSDQQMLQCLFTENRKTLTVSGAAADTFAVYCNSALIDTITLVATTEVWGFGERCRTFKVDMSANGTEAATLDCEEGN